MQKLKYVLAIGALILSKGTLAQHLQFHQPFAPSLSWTVDVEKPFRQNICLNGKWQFAPADLPAGFREGVDPTPALPEFSTKNLDKTPIRIPSPWNVNSFADKNGQGGDFITFPSYPKIWENIKMGWLRRTFMVPAGWKNKNVKLHFEAIAGDAEIVVNGHLAGHHFGIFLPFDLDISKYLKYGGGNEVAVGIRKASLFDQKGDHGRRSYQAGSFWGQHIAGIWQDVELVATPKIYIAGVFIKPEVEAGKVIAEVTLKNTGQKPVKLHLSAGVHEWINLAEKSTLTAPIPRGKLRQQPSLSIPDREINIAASAEKVVLLSVDVNRKLKLWSPDTPNLYGLVVKVTAGGKDADVSFQRFGWRQTSIRGKEFLLNGNPIVLKGDSWHFMGIPQMTRRYAWAWFTALKAAHLNAVRLHAQPYPSFYLDMADEMGIMVLDESAMWASDGGPKLDDSLYWKDSEKHIAELVRRDRNHPSVFGWSVSNEIMPIVRGVMHNPPGMKEQLIRHYKIWADTCKMIDPTRPWISADGEDDGEGQLPVYIVHYGGFQSMDRGLKSSKPWGVGEAGNAYYGTPEQVAGTNGDRAFESFLGRMEGVAVSSYQSLLAQQQRKAAYRSVFNLVWYGLQPLSLGMRDTTRTPQIDDGVYFPYYQEGVEGVQPERLGPYTTTLNPGYDPSLPLYKTWPLFEAIRDASAEEPFASKWAKAKETAPSEGTKPTTPVSFRLIGGPNSHLQDQFKAIGLRTDKQTSGNEQLLLIDGNTPPDGSASKEISAVLARGGKVIVWGVSSAGLAQLNQLLPAPLNLTRRVASSLVIKHPHQAVNGLSLSDLYFSEQSPAEIFTTGLSGPFSTQSQVILEDCNTDWLKWNKQPEFAKTAMIIRSEREKKLPGVIMISSKKGAGEWIINTFPADSRLLKVQLAIRRILSNLGLPLSEDAAAAGAIRKGQIIHVLSSQTVTYPGIRQMPAEIPPDNNKAATIKSGTATGGKHWESIYNETGIFNLGKARADSATNVRFLSCWISSPRSLEDLLLEPNLPTLTLEASSNGLIQTWLNGNLVLDNSGSAIKTDTSLKSAPLKLRLGWNHLYFKLIQTNKNWNFSAKLRSTQPEFLDQLGSAIEKP